MLVLGIDPGLRLTGFACIRFASAHPGAELAVLDAGVIRLKESQSVSARLVVLARELREIIASNAPDLASVESLFSHYQNPRTAITMAHARGVILCEIERAALPLCELPPAEVKKSIAGNGRASKEAVQRSVAAHLGLSSPPSPADIADAMAIAMVGGRRHLADTALRAAIAPGDAKA